LILFIYHENELRELGECVLKTGEKLVDFHHLLLSLSDVDVETRDNTPWFRNLGHASDFYYFLLLHFVAHGVLFTNFEPYEEDGSEAIFMRDIIDPAIQKIEKRFGIKPLIVRMYPLNQNTEEDFYWWSYPKNVNDWIVEYAKKNNLTFKKVDLK